MPQYCGKAANQASRSTLPISTLPIYLNSPYLYSPYLSYDFDGMHEFLSEALKDVPSGLVVGVKTTPYFYEQQFEGCAAVVNEFEGKLSFLTAINTVGNGLMIDVDTEAPLLAPGSYGGLAGPAVLAIALGNVRKLRQKLSPSVAVVGCGGVDSGEAAFKHLLCGAEGVMVASALLHEGPAVFGRIESELKAIMSAKGYTSIDEFRGKLRDGAESSDLDDVREAAA